MTGPQDRVERRYAEAERATERGRQATVRRGPVSLIAVCLGVALIVGVVAAVDLRRLQTPRGTALAWTGAAVFGDCTAFRRLSLDRRDLPAGQEDARCLDLRRLTAPARDLPTDVDIAVVQVRQQQPRSASVTVRVRRPGGGQKDVRLSLARQGGGWAVVVDEATCAAVPCA